MTDLEQHFLAGESLSAFRSVLSVLPLNGRSVIEIGAGRGALTRLILEREVSSLYAFEIEAGLCRVDDVRCSVVEGDARETLAWRSGHDTLISSPPYSLLPWLGCQIRELGIRNVVLSIPEKLKYQYQEEGYVVAAEVDGSNFDPPSKGKHLIVVKGFGPSSGSPQGIEALCEQARPLLEAFWTRDIAKFMTLVFPSSWSALSARILESGVTMSNEMSPWAPRWTTISPTARLGSNLVETAVKSCLYRAHDALHQLWGLPIPGRGLTLEDFYAYKRAQMCGEVAVLTLTEFALAQSLAQRFPLLKDFLHTRNALPMLEDGGPLHGKSFAQIAARLDCVLHKHQRPRWVRDNEAATAFADDYVPMLEEDRRMVDSNWQLMKISGWYPESLPNARYSPNLDGLELTLWMIQDFEHLMDTDPVVDNALMMFNRQRRAGVCLPEGWNAL